MSNVTKKIKISSFYDSIDNPLNFVAMQHLYFLINPVDIATS